MPSRNPFRDSEAQVLGPIFLHPAAETAHRSIYFRKLVRYR
jgi:hypothetical protein